MDRGCKGIGHRFGSAGSLPSLRQSASCCERRQHRWLEKIRAHFAMPELWLSKHFADGWKELAAKKAWPNIVGYRNIFRTYSRSTGVQYARRRYGTDRNRASTCQ